MRDFIKKPLWHVIRSHAFFAILISLCQATIQAQISSVVFEDDFSSNAIDPGTYEQATPFFEGGVGDIHAEAGDGVMRFVGTTTQQWWSGGTLKLKQSFQATPDTPVTISIDRVAEAGQGTASRSALWIFDETETSYVLFADVRGEGGWRYNRKIGEDGDVPTGGGNNMAAFDGAAYDDGGLHTMSIVANGSTVKLLLDGVEGAEVAFPFENVQFQFGSFARANDDTADTTWDNLAVETVLGLSVVFEDDFSSNDIDPARYEQATPFFEGGVGDIHAEAGDGVMRFVGTTTQQWWSGGTLKIKETYNAGQDSPVNISIDRVAEAGQGTASRSALWIFDETETNYVLFADVRGEGGWRYNRKIGEDGDVPTGGGNNMAAFDGAAFDDGGLHTMSIVANGSTVKLLLDGVEGAEVAFPFSKVSFQFGSFARANDDTADTTWDNLQIKAVPQQSNVVFSDDFSGNSIDPNRFAADSPFFEGGVGDIHAEAGDGVMRFVGTTTQQWWSGGTLRVVPTFAPSESETITLSIDRVAEAGQGTASRSALWILDETQTNYILFADVRGEGGWRYNRKIGQDGDVPTGGGNNMAVFDGDAFDDGGLHTMSMVADGQTVKLLLDGIEGAEVQFPFSPVIFQFGSYARANDDTADTTWDNLVIESEGGATFDPGAVSVTEGGLSQPVNVRIPQGLNSQRDITLTISSADTSIATPVGGSNGKLALVFPAGGDNTQSFRVQGGALGGTELSIQGDLAGGNRLSVAVISGPGALLEDGFGASLNAANWVVSNEGLGGGEGDSTVSVEDGELKVFTYALSDGWAGASAKTKDGYLAVQDLHLVFEVDRVSIDQFGTAGRAGVMISNDDRSKFVFLSQQYDENDNISWQANVNPGSPTGGGVGIAAFNQFESLGEYRIGMVANGSEVEVFVNGVSGGTFPFEVSTGIHFELGAYAQSSDDDATGVFDNVTIENVLPCVDTSMDNVTLTLADRSQSFEVFVPQLLNADQDVQVTITSSNPDAAIPAGASGGSLVLNFPAGSASTQSVSIIPVGIGSTQFSLSNNAGACDESGVKVSVTAVPDTLLSDDFSADGLSGWTQDDIALDGTGLATEGSGVRVENGQVVIDVTVETPLWPGFALFTSETFSASAGEPLAFELDRTDLDFVLTTGTGSEQRTGVYVRDGSGNFIFFNDYVAHDGRNYGWRYNKSVGDDDDDPSGAGVNIPAFDGGKFDDRGAHRMKILANGETVKLYLDDVFGVEIPFAASSGISFGFGTYCDEAGNVAIGYFDNALVKGGSIPFVAQGNIDGYSVQDGNIVIEYTGTLKSAAEATGPYTPVAGAASPYSVTPAKAAEFFIAE